jgi:hypothetical protein
MSTELAHGTDVHDVFSVCPQVEALRHTPKEYLGNMLASTPLIDKKRRQSGRAHLAIIGAGGDQGIVERVPGRPAYQHKMHPSTRKK